MDKPRHAVGEHARGVIVGTGIATSGIVGDIVGEEEADDFVLRGLSLIAAGVADEKVIKEAELPGKGVSENGKVADLACFSKIIIAALFPVLMSHEKVGGGILLLSKVSDLAEIAAPLTLRGAIADILGGDLVACLDVFHGPAALCREEGVFLSVHEGDELNLCGDAACLVHVKVVE